MGANAELLKVMVPELELLLPALDERGRRLALGAVARAAGDGGIGAVARMTGASWQTVADGAAELASGDIAPPDRVRRPGGGRKKLADTDPGLLPALLDLVEDSTRGDPESTLRWTTRSMRHLAEELAARGHPCSPQTAWRLLREQGYSMQSSAKVLEGSGHPDRDAQFRYIDGQAKEHIAAGQPVVSVDAKKREQVGNFAQGGREWRPGGSPVQVLDHSFPDGEDGHAVPYGVCDVAANTGFVNVGTDANTGAFAVASLCSWWDIAGRGAYPDATRLLVTCDAGSSNGWRNRAWKKGLARFAAGTGLEVTVCHFPPGTSKWNKIEHRLFSQVSHAWRGRPLTSYDVIINTIGAVTTKTGLSATAVLDRQPYPAGQEVSDQQMKDIEDRWLTRHGFHGRWNYTVLPVPRPVPEPAPGRARPGRVPAAALNHPALTGMDPQDLPALAAAAEVPAAARREQDRYARRGGPRRNKGRTTGPLPRLDTAGLVTAARIRQHLSLPLRVLAPLFGLSQPALSIALKPVTQALAGLPQPAAAPPPATPPRTTAQLREYAEAHGINLEITPPDAADTPQIPH
jgi:hypothetical protein